MSGGPLPSEDDDVARDSMHERVLEQEMKDDTSATTRACAPGTAVRRGSGTESTWNFVQMNMTLLPIARPLPVSISNRIYDGVIGRKPRTPNQKLHHRVLRNASNISPRHNEDNMLRRRGSTSSENGTAASYGIPRQAMTERQYSVPNSIPSRCGKRKSEDIDHDMSSPGPNPVFCRQEHHDQSGNDECRGRSFSEDLSMRDSGPKLLDATIEKFVLSRSASTSSAFAHLGPLFKDKRILEIQDEERRLLPDERATLPSPSKRSRRV